MVLVHEIVFGFEDGTSIHTFLEKGTVSYVWEYVISPINPATIATVTRSHVGYILAEDCFEDLSKAVRRYADSRSTLITTLNNVCNAPFVDKLKQIEVLLDKLHIQPAVLVNGQS